MTAVDYRMATRDDLAALSELNQQVQDLHAAALPHLFKQSAGPAFNADELLRALDNANYVIYLAECEGKAAGYVMAEATHRNADERHHASSMIHIHHICVDQHMHKRGIGKGLLDKVKQQARALNIDTMALDVWSFNEEARGFFQKYGLVPYNEKRWCSTQQ